MNGTNLKVGNAIAKIELEAKNPFKGDDDATAVFTSIVERLGERKIFVSARDKVYISYEGPDWVQEVERDVERRLQGATEQVKAFKKTRKLLRLMDKKESISTEMAIKEGV